MQYTFGKNEQVLPELMSNGMTQATTEYGNKIFIEKSMMSDTSGFTHDHININRFRHDVITKERKDQQTKIKMPLEILTRHPQIVKQAQENYFRDLQNETV